MQHLQEQFQSLFDQHPLVYRSPGRINLIGEHTDYNNGYVLPAAIDLGITFCLSRSNQPTHRFMASDLNEQVDLSISENSIAPGTWTAYVNGILQVLLAEGLEVPPVNCLFGGNIPVGAGVSSSAALECGLLYALNDLMELGLDTLTMARLAQRAEHEFVGVRCGIMDQYANLFGKEGHVLQLDCRSLEHRYYPFDNQQYRIVLCDTQVKHSLASSAYNKRREECETGVSLIRKIYPQVESLRDVSSRELASVADQLPRDVFKRCHYVIAENERVLQTCMALQDHDYRSVGEHMYASHNGLQKEYEVSCRELDVLVDYTRPLQNVIGSRMMGGGFGGCTINIVLPAYLEEFREKIAAHYQETMGRELVLYEVSAEAGTERIA